MCLHVSVELPSKKNCTESEKIVIKIEIYKTNISILVKVTTEFHLQVALRRKLANSHCTNSILRAEEFCRLLQLVTLREELPWLFVQPHTMNSTHNITVLSLLIDHLHRTEITKKKLFSQKSIQYHSQPVHVKPKSSTCKWSLSSKIWYYLDNPLAHMKNMVLMVIEGFIF